MIVVRLVGFSKVSLAAALVALALALAGCAKSGTTFDEDFARAEDDEPGDGESGSGGDGESGSGQGTGESGSGGGDPICGNGVIDGGEECDGTLLGGATCQTLGFDGGGALLCDPQTCTYDEAMCRLANMPGVNGGGRAGSGGSGNGPRGGTGG